MLNHVLLEVVCMKNSDCYADDPIPDYCRTKCEYACYHCLLNSCKYLDFTSCENTLCYIGEDSDMEHGILFGGDMEEGEPTIGVDEWRRIAFAKIDEAYHQFMEEKKT